MSNETPGDTSPPASGLGRPPRVSLTPPGENDKESTEKRSGQAKGASTRASVADDGITDCKLEAGAHVWVRVRSKGEEEKDDTFEWIRGEIIEVSQMPCNLDRKDFKGKIVVQVQSESGGKFSPETWSRNCPGSIPLQEDDTFKTSKWVKHYDNFHFESLSDADRSVHRVLKTNAGQMGFDRARQSSSEANDLDDILLRDRFGLSIGDQIQLLMEKPEVSRIFNLANGSEGMAPDAVHSIAYLFGQIVGAELSALSASQDEARSTDAAWILNGCNNLSREKLDQLQDLDCPILKTFALAVAVHRVKKGQKFDPKGGLWDDSRPEAMKRLLNPASSSKRLGKVMAAISNLHGSQYDVVQKRGPASAAIFHGILMLLDAKGASDKLMNQLSSLGVGCQARALRDFMLEAAAGIDPNKVRAKRGDGKVPIVVDVADNADFSLFSRVVSVIPIGDVLIGYESEEDCKYLNEEYLGGLSLPDDDVADRIMPDEDDDAIAKWRRRIQNAAALVIAKLDSKQKYMTGGSSLEELRGVACDFSVGDRVKATYRHEKRIGKVKTIDGMTGTLAIEYEEGNNRRRTFRCPANRATLATEEDNSEQQNETGRSGSSSTGGAVGAQSQEHDESVPRQATGSNNVENQGEPARQAKTPKRPSSPFSVGF